MRPRGISRRSGNKILACCWSGATLGSRSPCRRGAGPSRRAATAAHMGPERALERIPVDRRHVRLVIASLISATAACPYGKTAERGADHEHEPADPPGHERCPEHHHRDAGPAYDLAAPVIERDEAEQVRITGDHGDHGERRNEP